MCYGPGAVGISAFSPVLLNWPQGGPIAIHGTNQPGMIGFAVSHGCLRVRNPDIRKLLSAAVREPRSRSGNEPALRAMASAPAQVVPKIVSRALRDVIILSASASASGSGG